MTDSSKSKPRPQGRPKISELEKKRREAARLQLEVDTVESEFKAALGLSENEAQTDRGQEVMRIAAERLHIAMKIDEFSQLIKNAREENQSKSRQADLKDQKTSYYNYIHQLPPLGYTKEEWRATRRQNVKREAGRPKVLLEQKVNRARTNFATAKEELSALEAKEGEASVDLREFGKKIDSKHIGRPPHSAVSKEICRTMARYDAELFHMRSGRAERERNETIRERMEQHGVSDPSELRTRLPTPISERLASIEEKYAELAVRLEEEESKMDELELARHNVDKKSTFLRAARKHAKRDDLTAEEQAQADAQVQELNRALKFANQEVERVIKLQDARQARKAGKAYQEDLEARNVDITKPQREEIELPASLSHEQVQASSDQIAHKVEASQAKPVRSRSTTTEARTVTKKEAIKPQESAPQAERVSESRRVAREETQQEVSNQGDVFASALDALLSDLGLDEEEVPAKPESKPSTLMDRLKMAANG